MRKILLVIDMQNDFINGALGTPEAEAIVDRVVEEIGKYPAGDVIATRDTHPENYLETQEGRNLPVVHCVKGTPGWELHPRIAAGGHRGSGSEGDRQIPCWGCDCHTGHPS